jgi:hypothetical protein
MGTAPVLSVVRRHTTRDAAVAVSAGAQDRHLHVRSPMRDPRYRFTDDVRASTRAIALRMIHAGGVAESPVELDAWIARTDDLRDTLTKAGYGSAFTSDDLFPLFQSFVAKASGSAVPRTGGDSPRRVWIWVIVTAAIAVIAFGIAVART